MRPTVALSLSATAIALILAAPLAAHDRDEIEFHNAGSLMPWCETVARAHFAGQGVPSYQWTGRHYENGNLLVVEGKIRAGGQDLAVTCRSARGARASYATMEIGGPA